MTSCIDTRGQLVFVDAVGGALSALAAGAARAAGVEGAFAATAAPPRALPQEVSDALKEVGVRVPVVTALADLDLDGATVVCVGNVQGVESATCSWPAALYSPKGGATSSDGFNLERRSTARVVRDELERRVEALRPRRAVPA